MSRKRATVAQIAASEGVSRRKMYRDIEFARAVDALAGYFGNGLNSELLTGKFKLPNKTVVALAQLPQKTQRELITLGPKAVIAALRASVPKSDLQIVVKAWPKLPDAVRTAIVAQVQENIHN